MFDGGIDFMDEDDTSSDMSSIHMDTSEEDINIYNLMKAYGVNNVVDTIKSYSIVYLNNDFFNPQNKNISKYVDAFGYICNNDKIPINYIIDVEKVLSQNSKNGKVYIINIKSNLKQKLLLKAPLHKNADNMSYEYYIGLVLNQLRKQNIPCFTLTYARFSNNISSTDTLSTFNNNGVSHIIYEYIENDDKTISLHDYINTLNSTLTNKEIIQIQTNLINILLMLLCVLNVAQDEFEFTHYDLHLNNILLYKLDKMTEYNITINGEIFVIVLEYFPYIIDYGRSHINYNIVKRQFGEIVDIENKKKYTNFKDFANTVCNKTFYIGNDTEVYLNTCIDNMLNNPSFVKKMKIKGVNSKAQLLDRYFVRSDNKITHNIDTLEYNNMFDTYKLIRSLCSTLLYRANTQRIGVWDYWQKLDAKIENSYPFYIPQFNHISSRYSSMDNKNNNTFEIISDIYKKIPKNSNKNIYKVQLGGGLKFKFKKIKKSIKLDNILDIYNNAFSKIKNKREYINKPDYSLVINRSVEYDH